MANDTEDTVPVIAFRPTVRHVAEEIPARALDSGGNRPGTFTEATIPTAEQVTSIIDKSLGEVVLTIGYKLPDSCVDGARRLVALHAAASIETGYWPEQNAAQTGLAARLDKLYDRLMPAVMQCIATNGAGGPDNDPETPDSAQPVWSTPSPGERAELAEISLIGYPDPRRLW